ncbi:hypothetical protein DPMN_060803 [Dreissena polymorpha]|uniref:Uncharacterized protein n=1 Tax=Dreissena polymorpha TaxID=45954 RepID=A0A9D4C6K1_DREPO|nr:hypothetical protein DPMN_060803 [Dreissena polymorpha]
MLYKFYQQLAKGECVDGILILDENACTSLLEMYHNREYHLTLYCVDTHLCLDFSSQTNTPALLCLKCITTGSTI